MLEVVVVPDKGGVVVEVALTIFPVMVSWLELTPPAPV